MSREFVIWTKNKRVVYTVVLGPLLCFFEAHEASLIAVLEVPNNLRALTELDSICKNCCTISNGYVNACDIGIGSSCKVKAVENTCRSIGKRYRYRISINVYVCFACHSNDGKLNSTNLICSRIRDSCRSSRKLKYGRVSYGNSLSTNNLATGDNLYINSTGLTVGNKLAVCNGTKGIIGKCPCSISGHIHLITVSINCLCAKGVSSLGGENVVVSLNIYNVKLTCGSNIGSDEDTVSGRTLRTVTRNGTHLEVFFTNTLGDECRRSTTVTVSSPLTAKSEHYFAFLIRRKTNRVVRATTVVHNENESTVFLNADHGTSSIVRTTRLFGCNKSAILNYHSKGYTNCVEKNSFFKILVNVSLVVRLNVTGNIALCILKYVEDGGSSVQNCTAGCYILVRITDPLAVVNKYTGRVGVVVKVCVHTTDNVVSEIILIILSHFGEFLMRPVSLIFQIFVDLVVSGNDGYIGVGRVYFNDVKNLSTGTCCIVKYHFGLNSSAWNEYVIFLGDYVVVAVCAKACTIENYVVLFPIRN